MRAGRGQSTLPAHGILDSRPGSNEEGNTADDFPHPILNLIFISVTSPPSLSALKLHTPLERAAARRKCHPRQHNSSHPSPIFTLMHFSAWHLHRARSSLILARARPTILQTPECSLFLVYYHSYLKILYIFLPFFKQHLSEPG